ncbi:MAG: hypothetical protein HYW25_01075 [Candidatus Aenigmarchaeota archaeon]|nr:hypothetical protein [Candidatus Aenigmarchaeota archaeon]
MKLKEELMNFEYREIILPLQEIFPQINIEKIKRQFLPLKYYNPYKTIFAVACELWNGGYQSIFTSSGFYDTKFEVFSGHCHQCTPALGLVLKALGFERVSYLECFRVREHFPKTGIIEQVPPTEEPNQEVREEFCSIGRIPYCCLEVVIDGQPHYLTGKHFKSQSSGAIALLTPVCYRDFVGVFRHQDDPSKSGIYLKPIVPENNPDEIDFSRRIVWMKQTAKDPAPEYFATFLRMHLQ